MKNKIIDLTDRGRQIRYYLALRLVERMRTTIREYFEYDQRSDIIIYIDINELKILYLVNLWMLSSKQS